MLIHAYSGFFLSYPIRIAALLSVVKREIPLRAYVYRADDVATTIRICEEFGLEVSWEQATEGHRIVTGLPRSLRYMGSKSDRQW